MCIRDSRAARPHRVRAESFPRPELFEQLRGDHAIIEGEHLAADLLALLVALAGDDHHVALARPRKRLLDRRSSLQLDLDRLSLDALEYFLDDRVVAAELLEPLRAGK